MAVPSKNFTIIPATDVDADSPLTETLMGQLKDNDIHLEEWLGDSYTAAKDHDHDGVNSKGITLSIAPTIADVDTIASPFQETNATFVTVGLRHYFYVASTGAKTLQILYRAFNNMATGEWHARTQIDGVTNTTDITSNNTSFADFTDSYDATALSVGWHYLELQIRNTNDGTANIGIHNVAIQ